MEGFLLSFKKKCPAYFVCFLGSSKVQKTDLVKCVTSTAAEQETLTEMATNLLPTGQLQKPKLVPLVRLQEEQAQPIKQEARCYPSRTRRRPDYFGEHVTETTDDQLQC